MLVITRWYTFPPGFSHGAVSPWDDLSPPPQSLPPLGDPLGAAQSQHHGLVSGADRTKRKRVGLGWWWLWKGQVQRIWVENIGKIHGFSKSWRSVDRKSMGFRCVFFFCHAILAFRFSSISFWDHGHPAFLRQTWCDFHLVQGVVLNDSGFSGFQNDDIVCWCRSREIKILLKIWVYAILCVILPYCSPWKRHIFAWIHPNPRFFFEQALKKNPSF